MERASRIARTVLAAATVALCLLLCFQAVDIYLGGAGYTREDVGSRLRACIPAFAGYAVLLIAGAALEHVSPRKETLPRHCGVRPAPKAPKAALVAGLYVLAAALVALGVWNGGLRDVLIKAINICTECIGLG